MIQVKCNGGSDRHHSSGGGQQLVGSTYILKVGPKRFIEALHVECERKHRIKDGFRCLGLESCWNVEGHPPFLDPTLIPPFL